MAPFRWPHLRSAEQSAGVPRPSKLGAKKSTQTFFVQSFSRTLRVMDVRAENRGRPHQKVRFSAAPVMGRNFLTQGRPGVRVRNVCGKSGPKSLCLCVFSSLTIPVSSHFLRSPGRRLFKKGGLCFHTGNHESYGNHEMTFRKQPPFNRGRTNMQQLTCNIDLSSSFYYLFFSFVLLELKNPLF